MSKLIQYWKPECGLRISIEDWQKAGFRISQYPKNIKELVFGAKKEKASL